MGGGVEFWVLGEHWVVHQSHRYEEEARREEVRSENLFRR